MPELTQKSSPHNEAESNKTELEHFQLLLSHAVSIASDLEDKFAIKHGRTLDLRRVDDFHLLSELLAKEGLTLRKLCDSANAKIVVPQQLIDNLLLNRESWIAGGATAAEVDRVVQEEFRLEEGLIGQEFVRNSLLRTHPHPPGTTKALLLMITPSGRPPSAEEWVRMVCSTGLSLEGLKDIVKSCVLIQNAASDWVHSEAVAKSKELRATFAGAYTFGNMSRMDRVVGALQIFFYDDLVQCIEERFSRDNNSMETILLRIANHR